MASILEDLGIIKDGKYLPDAEERFQQRLSKLIEGQVQKSLAKHLAVKSEAIDSTLLFKADQLLSRAEARKIFNRSMQYFKTAEEKGGLVPRNSKGEVVEPQGRDAWEWRYYYAVDILKYVLSGSRKESREIDDVTNRIKYGKRGRPRKIIRENAQGAHQVDAKGGNEQERGDTNRLPGSGEHQGAS